ncbi:hypothetical protein A2159_03470 [Candidatus Woesebacteria bacterium RBG_13_34_9]|uniref:Double zinc ribbon domain-containing protein n=1 Tax=Candidatus Woesebacteria bacterium RBG_13_34_9 TaxID=1802477 RepID=A0A1F7X738_9BACT|nr:MAG: hypothetical protein A2159_03470 [Candidatus Woesebacteria bacterium RBG_13_34_9]
MDLFDFMFPKKCLECGKEGRYICFSCLKKLPQIKQKCPYCEKASIDGATHIKCIKKFRIDGIYSLWPYQGVIRKAILNLKFNFAQVVADELSEYMFFILKKLPVFPKNSVITPIPLHFLRKNFRGFNQSDIIAKSLCERMGWVYDSNILQRKLIRKSQTELRQDERAENIKGVFSLISDRQPLSIDYILFDDVCTTGSTLKEATKVLKRKGIKKVWGLTIAR